MNELNIELYCGLLRWNEKRKTEKQSKPDEVCQGKLLKCSLPFDVSVSVCLRIRGLAQVCVCAGNSKLIYSMLCYGEDQREKDWFILSSHPPPPLPPLLELNVMSNICQLRAPQKNNISRQFIDAERERERAKTQQAAQDECPCVRSDPTHNSHGLWLISFYLMQTHSPSTTNNENEEKNSKKRERKKRKKTFFVCFRRLRRLSSHISIVLFWVFFSLFGGILLLSFSLSFHSLSLSTSWNVTHSLTHGHIDIVIIRLKIFENKNLISYACDSSMLCCGATTHAIHARTVAHAYRTHTQTETGSSVIMLSSMLVCLSLRSKHFGYTQLWIVWATRSLNDSTLRSFFLSVDLIQIS